MYVAGVRPDLVNRKFGTVNVTPRQTFIMEVIDQGPGLLRHFQDKTRVS